MQYKEIYDELQKALWDEEGLLIRLYDPFHNSLGNLKRPETLETIDIAKKFANKLALDTKDEYVLKTLNLICQFIGESFIHADVLEFGDTEYNPEFMFGSLKIKNAKEPKPKKTYVVKTITVNDEDKSKKEDNKEFFFYTDAKEYMESCVKNIRKLDEQLIKEGMESVIAIDKEKKFSTINKDYVVKIIEK